MKGSVARVAFSDIGEVATWGPEGLKIVPTEHLRFGH